MQYNNIGKVINFFNFHCCLMDAMSLQIAHVTVEYLGKIGRSNEKNRKDCGQKRKEILGTFEA